MKFNFKNEENRIILAFVAVCILWGSTYLAIRIGVGEFPPLIFAGVRFLIAGSLMVAYAFFKHEPIPRNPKDILKISTVGLFLLLGGNGCVVFAETWVNSGVASVLVATVPLFMVIIELIFRLNKKVALKSWVGLLIGFLGVVLLVLSNSNTGAVDFKGPLVLLFGSLMWASGSVFSKTFKAEGSIVAQIGIQMLAGGIGLTLAAALHGELFSIHVTSKGIGAIAYLIIFGSIIGYSCYIYILKKWPAAKAGTYAYINPVVAVFLGAIILNEPITLSIIFSTVIILLGVLLVQTSKN